MPDDGDISKSLTVVVAEDRLKAWLQVHGVSRPDFVPPTVEAVMRVLEQAKIALTDEVRARVQQLVATVTQAAEAARAGMQPELPKAFLIAEGRSPVDAEDGQFIWNSELRQRLAFPGDDGQRIDYFALNSIVTVAAGTRVGRVVPPKDGQPGLDVFGQERPPRKPRGMPVKLGPGLRLLEDSNEVVAAMDGRVAEERGQIRLYEVLDVPGDVDFASGSIDACVDVTVRGTVRTRFSVRTTKSLAVDRVIEAAHVEVGGNIVVRGGIFGQDRRCLVRAAGNIAAHLLNEAYVWAGGDIQFNKEVINSRVYASGRLIGPRGTIIGGEVYAREGIEALVVGSEAGVVTCLAVGTDVNVLRRVRRMEQQVKELTKSAEQIRRAIMPLMANLKRLVPAQRERATELLSRADEIEAQVEEMQKRCQQCLSDAAPKGKPYVLIAEAAHPGTRISIGPRQTHLQSLLYGPVKIEMRKVQDVTEMVAVNQRTGSITVLPSMDVDLDAPPTDEPAEPEKARTEHEPSVDKQSA